jgi:hypothetical protein
MNMKTIRHVFATGAVAMVLGCALIGCGEKEPEPVGTPVEITPAMEDMKQEMMKNFQNKTYGVEK